MARAPKQPMLSKSKKPRKTANALGYAKRKSLKSKTLQGADDVYEYQAEKVRRSKVQLALEKDELAGAPGEESAEEDEEEGRGTELRPRLVGEGDDDEGIAEDEDEDIDSDDAFDESDEERFAGFNFSQKKSKTSKQAVAKSKTSTTKGVRFAEVDLNEDDDDAEAEDDGEEEGSHQDEDEEEEDEEEEGDPEEFIDVLDILDGRGEPDSGDDMGEVETEGKRGASRTSHADEDSEDEARMSEGDSDDEEDEDDTPKEDPISIDPDEDIDVDDSALQNLQSFITGLDAGTKRKASDADTLQDRAGESRKRKRRLLQEQTQGGTENEFAAQTGATKLNLDDLLAPLASSSASLQSLKKSAKVLASTSSKAKTLAAPLPQRTQERLDRQAAYEQTKEEVDKWSATMKRIKEAEHLSFPLQAEPVGKPSNLELTAKFKPTTEMESAVDRLLKSAKMREQDIAQTESLKMNHLSVEEVATRRAELAKMRDLMFRNEAKAKRIAKIKSKTYRRLKKKQKDKLAAKIAELEGEDDEDDEDAQMKIEIDRARERATLRHKNTGKWAKAMKARGELEADQRKEINEMLDRGEKLRRRIQGRGSDDESDEDDDESGDDGDDAAEHIRAGAFDELARLRDDGDEDASTVGKKGKSVFEMKFMKDAALRDKHRVDKMEDDFVKEMNGLVSGEDSDDDEPAGGNQVQDTALQRVGGRVSYRPGNMPALQTVPSLASDTSSVTLKSTDLPPTEHPESPVSISPLVETHAAAEPSNPWLSHEGTKVVQKKHEVAVGKDSAGAEKSKNKLRKRVKKREEEKAKAKDDAAVDITMSDVMTLGSTSNAPSAKAKGKQKATAGPSRMTAVEDDDDDDENSEIDQQEKRLELKGKGKTKGVKAFEQRDLVALAFAGDNVVRDFAEAKRREIQEDAPKEVDTTLPGWGSWGGLGTKKAPPKPYLVKKVVGVDPTSRSDFNKAHVIISEKRDKKAAKYMVKDLPFPYTSKAQFERSMDMPIGTEWNTRVGFQRGTLPRVVKKMGTVITPLEKLT